MGRTDHDERSAGGRSVAARPVPAEGATRRAGAVGTDHAARPGPVALAMAAVLMLLTTGGYVGLTWARAQDVCAQEVADPRVGRAPSVEVDWSWRPVGVRCSWHDGSRTSLWWGMHQP